MGDVFEGGDCGKGKMEGSGSWELGIEWNKRGYFRKGPLMVLLDGCDDSKGKRELIARNELSTS